MTGCDTGETRPMLAGCVSERWDRLFEVNGGHALFDSSALQPYHRDIHAASHHVALHWAPVAEQYGRVRLGLEPTSPWV